MKNRETWEIIPLHCNCGCDFLWTATSDDITVVVECPDCKTKTELIRHEFNNQREVDEND